MSDGELLKQVKELKREVKDMRNAVNFILTMMMEDEGEEEEFGSHPMPDSKNDSTFLPYT